MPNSVVHDIFSSKVFDRLSHDIQSKINIPVFKHASFGPDIWFSALYTNRKHKSLVERCSYMHKNKCGIFLVSLAGAVNKQEEPSLLFAYLCGFLCHYYLDYITHPYILYKTGNTFDHVRFELALDCLFIHDVYGCESADFNFSQILPDKALPSGLKDPIDQIYYDVFGWTNAFSELSLCTLGLHKFFGRIRDPYGLYALFLKTKSSIIQHDIKIQTYHKKDDLSMTADFLNNSHQIWRNPFAPEFISSESFVELMHVALGRCAECIQSCYQHIFFSEDRDLLEIIGDKSYESGLECSDIRNDQICCFENVFNKKN